MRTYEVDHEAIRQSVPGFVRTLGVWLAIAVIFTAIALIAAITENSQFALPGGRWWYLWCGVIPVAAAMLMAYEPIALKPQEGVRLLYSHFWWHNPASEWLQHWAMWPAIIVALVATARGICWLIQDQAASFSWAGALGLLAIAGFTGVFAFALLFAREEARLLEEGMQFGKTRIIRWDQLGAVIDTGNHFELFVKNAPHQPFSVVAKPGSTTRDLLLTAFHSHGVTPTPGAASWSLLTNLVILVCGAAILCGALLAIYTWRIDARWVLLATWIVSGVFQGLFELMRGTYAPARAGRVDMRTDEIE